MNPLKNSADFLKGELVGNCSGWTRCGCEKEVWLWLRLMRAVNAPPEFVSGGEGVVCLSSSSNMEFDPVTDMLSFSKWSSSSRLLLSVRDIEGIMVGLTRFSLTSRSGCLVSGVGIDDE